MTISKKILILLALWLIVAAGQVSAKETRLTLLHSSNLKAYILPCPT